MLTRRSALRMAVCTALAATVAPAFLAAADAEPPPPRRRRLKPRKALPDEAFGARVRVQLVTGEVPCQLSGTAVRVTGLIAGWDPAQRGHRTTICYAQLQPQAEPRRLRLALIGPDGSPADEALIALPLAAAGRAGPLGTVSTAAGSVDWTTRLLSPAQRTVELSWAD